MAFFSNTGTKIYSGAAGYPGLRMAYKDGSLGAQDIRALTAYQDGSLGGFGYGPREAFQDGSLGASGPGPLRSFEDGSLGMPLFLETGKGMQRVDEPITIHHGTMGEYFTGTAGCSSCGGLGQTEGAVPTLDLNDPAVLKEVKQILMSAPWMMPYLSVPEIQAELSTDAGVWTAFTSTLVNSWISGYTEFAFADAANPPKNQDGSPMTKSQYLTELTTNFFPAPEMYPTYSGISVLYLAAQSMMQGANPVISPNSFPLVQAYLSAVGASGGAGTVIPPGGGSAKMDPLEANLVNIGIGVAVLAFMGAMVFSKKKRR